MDSDTKNMLPKLTILFANRRALDSHMEKNTVLIVPTSNDWNDFGFRIRVDVRARIEDTAMPIRLQGFIGFISEAVDASNGIEPINELLRQTGAETVPVGKIPIPFFMMLPDMESYRALVKELGVSMANVLLHQLNDIVASAQRLPKPDWIARALQTDVFQQAFLRNAESYFAYKNAGPVLGGLEFEEVGSLSRAVHIRFQLAGKANPHDLTFRFDHDAVLPKRIAVIIGKNGVGKSQTLGRIAKAALSGGNELADGDTGERLLVNRILAFAPTNEARAVFPNGRVKRPRVWYRRFSLNRSGSARNSDSISDQIIQLVRSPQVLARSTRWDIFLDALRVIDQWEQLALVRKGDGALPITLHELALTNEQSLLRRLGAINTNREPVRMINGRAYPLSSGEISFLRFAAQASLHIENGSLLLLDEPETHLHPNFVSQFAALLDRLLERTGSVAIIATHSAYVVREVFQDQVVVLRSDEDGFVQWEQPLLRTFGADVGAISYFVFGEDNASRMAHALETRLKQQFGTWEALKEAYKDQLSLEMLGALRQSMEPVQ